MKRQTQYQKPCNRQKQQIKIQQESPNDLLPFEQTYRFHISTDYYKCPINSINYDTK